MTAQTRPADPAPAGPLPSLSPARQLGSYAQKQEGLMMQRIPLLAGQIGWSQWRTIAELAVRYTHSAPLHLTTRQDIELHNLPRASVSALYQELLQVGISTFGACGDTIRNITVNPACEFDPQDFDLLPLARLVKDYLQEWAAGGALPRKFKVSFSGCRDNHACPFISDLGFVCRADGFFQAVGAGSLGSRPQTGIFLYEKLSPEQILPLCKAAIEMFAELGDRQNRQKARLRHIRQRLGDQTFKEQLEERFQIARQRPWPKVILSRGRSDCRRLYTLQIPAGDLAPHLALELAQAAQGQGAYLRINQSHGLELYGPRQFALPKALLAFADLPCVVACPGAAVCPRALVHTKEAALQIQRMQGINISGKKIALSGCPNGCAQSAAADIGLIGRIKTIDGQKKECFDVYLGGENGQTDKLAEYVQTVSAERLSRWFLERTETVNAQSYSVNPGISSG